MQRTTRQKSASSPKRAGTAERILSAVLGWTLIVFGAILVISVLSLLVLGDLPGLILLPFCLATCAGGVYILRLRKLVLCAPGPAAEPAAPGAVQPDTVQPVMIPQEAPQPQEAPASQEPQASSATASSEPAPAQKTPEDTEDVAHLVFRTHDLFATLRDLVRHAQSDETDKLHLATMLKAAGIMEWPDAPACTGGRLSRNACFWIRTNADDLSDDHYDTLIAAEAALGVNQDLPRLRSLPLDNARVLQETLKLMRSMVEQRIEPCQLTEDGLRAAYGSDGEKASCGEWVIRSRISNAAECLSAPFRVVYDLRANSAQGLVVLKLECPRPQCMAIFTPDATRQVNLARAYAFRLCVTLASHALDASPKVRRVVVNAHERAQVSTLLSLDADRDTIDELRAFATGTGVELGLPQHERLRANPTAAWFESVEPFVSFYDPAAEPAHANTFPELDDRPASEALARTCGARHIYDLGINENAVRIKAWEDIYPRLGTTTEQAVSALVAARNEASDITVAEACNRTMQALVNGEADLERRDALAHLFVDGSTLDMAVERANRLLDDSEDNADPETVVRLLENALAPIEDMGIYLDDERNAYRYFGSVSERINHNLFVNEGGREVCLVPDSYFNAHSSASIALGMLGELDRALAHAEICLRLAPTSIFATMRKVRILEAQSRTYEAADLIIAALQHATTPRDAAICHYRLAYMEWKLGREDLAAACYQRSLSWDTEVASQSQEELDDLLSSNENLERPTAEQADALLAREGIPLGCVRTDGEHTLGAAVACMDAGALLSAQTLLSVLFAMKSDDVVMGVYRSLKVSV